MMAASGHILSMGINAVDAALSLGVPSARREGMRANKHTRNTIQSLVTEDSVVEFFWIGERNTKVPAFTGVSDGDAITYEHSPKDNAWILSETVLRATPVVASGLVIQRAQMRDEITKLKNELATAHLDNELMRHELERFRQREVIKTAKPMFSYFQKFLFGLLVGLLFVSLLPSANAQEFEEDVCDLNENMDNTHERWDLYIEHAHARTREYFRDWIEQGRKLLTPEGFITWYVYLTSNWLLQVVLFVIIGYFKYSNLTPTLIVSLLATWSKWHSTAFIPLSHCDVGSLIMYCVMLFLWPLHPGFSCGFWAIGFTSYLISCICGGERDVDSALAGGFATLSALGIEVFAEKFSLPRVVIPIIYIIYRIFFFLLRRPEIVTTRDASGKIVETRVVPEKNSAFSKFSQSLRRVKSKLMFWQKTPRVNVSHFFQVPSQATAVVRTEIGTGTAFRVQNFLVTAKHVFGESDVCEVVWEGTTHAAKIKYRHPDKDIVFVSLPTGMQGIKAFKIGNFEDGPIAIVTRSGDFVNFATAEGVKIKNEITYAITTPDGSSGAPVIIQTGRVVGVHVINTGFAAGGVVLTPEDMMFTQPKENKQIVELKAEIARLKSEHKMEQNFVTEDSIVNLVRDAIRREMVILRRELVSDVDTDDDDDEFLQKKKGKTKTKRARGGHGNRSRGKKKAIWTEAQYKKLLEEGFSTDELKKMADSLREQREQEEDDAMNDEDWYPHHPDLETEDEEEINRDWFGQYKKDGKKSKFNQYWLDTFTAPTIRTAPQHVVETFTPDLTDELAKKFEPEILRKLDKIKNLLTFAIDNGRWRFDVDVRVLLEDLINMWYDVNEATFLAGLPTFIQLKKEKRAKEAKEHQDKKQDAKNGERPLDVQGQKKKTPPQKSTV